ncbi:hypothetical protein QFC19_001103 [Naganishia cerealis]|uniref:Uncharacterized protein n=1 Tax=Naganishia cerealis TaxID=610337 RepID=A0ACC2WJY9_9TREE|nr:hypothetical protein QFC19_001103 [Naganishia cerealis]
MSMFGLTSSGAYKGTRTRTRTLLLGEDGNPRTYRFEGSGLELGEGWRKVNIIIPMPPNIEPTPTMANISNKPAVETETPFLKIKHKLRIRIVCRSTALPGQDTIVVLTTPLKCGTAPTPRRLNLVPASPINATAGYRIVQPSSSLGQQPLSSFSSLPAYCQMFHENGTTREDEDILPLYSPDSPPSYAPFTSQGVGDGTWPNDSSGSNSFLESSPVPAGTIDSSGTTNSVMGITSDHMADEELTAGTTASDESLPSVPGPRDCRSVSPLYSDIDSNDSFEEAHEHHGSYGSPYRAERATARGTRLSSARQDHLMSADRSSSEVSLPDYLEAARRRAVARSKYRQPSSSSLSRSAATL